MNLFQKLLEVRQTVDGLKKENRNDHYKFDYVSSTQVLLAVRDKMNELGLLLVPTVTSANVNMGGKQLLTELHITYTWIDVENPEDKLEIPWYAQGVDSGEKGPGKAYTYGEKYFLLKFFNIPTDKDDPDSKGDKFDGAKPPPAKQPVTTQPKKKPVQVASSPQETLKNRLLEEQCDLNYVAMYMADIGFVAKDDEGTPDMSTLSAGNARLALEDFDRFHAAFSDWAGDLAHTDSNAQATTE